MYSSTDQRQSAATGSEFSATAASAHGNVFKGSFKDDAAQAAPIGSTRLSRLSRSWFKARGYLAQWRGTLPGWLTSYISPLGWLVAGLAMVCLAAFPALGWHELLSCGIIGLLLLACGIVMSLGNTRFHVTLSVSENRIKVGDTVSVHLNVSNHTKSPTMAVRGDLPMGSSSERFLIPILPPGKSTDRQVAFHATSRAVIPVGPLKISKGDPFGIVRHEQSLAQSAKIFIHPKTVVLNTLDSGMFRDLEGSPSGQVVDDDLDFYGLREYRPGDDTRNIHWLSSAKTGTMMVRQYEASKRTDTSITLGVNPADYSSEDEFELAISTAASIGAECLLEDRPLSIHTASDSLAAQSATGFLDWMSAIKPDMDENQNLALATLATSPNASFYFFVVGSATSLSHLHRIAATLPAESICVMLKIDSASDNVIGRYDDFTLAAFATLDDLPVIMEALK